MKPIVVALLLITASALPCCNATTQSNPDNDQSYVSLVQLISTPERFNGKRIVVTGFLQLGSEQNLLYLHEQDSAHGILENAVLVNTNGQVRKGKEQLNMKYVRIVGFFRTADRQRSPFNSGTIGNIESCRFWSDPAHPMRERIKEMLNK
jgi:hypothetical protein